MRCFNPLRWSHLLGLLLLSAPGFAAELPLFAADEIIDIELRGPLHETIRDTRDRAERPFELIVGDASLDVHVRVRGNSRVDVCRFPPLRLRFGSAAATPFSGQEKLKLVSHCNAGRSYALNVLREYAAYRIMALLAHASLRVRLLRIRYIDTDKPDANAPVHFGFVLESTRELAQRLGGQRVKLEGVTASSLERSQLETVFVGQYLLGNTDWSLVTAKGAKNCCHNGILVKVGDKLHYVPYDFDLAGLVDASYGRQKGASKRRPERRYVGYCMDGLDLPGTISRIAAAEEDIWGILDEIEANSGNSLEDSRRFLAGFFQEAKRPDRLSARFMR
jgi:hypothetical protein